ncbi:hypothetical protein [Pseudonocardia parietis]|uniref:Uncharacterized protein n=1 Tax=Pseudonocardia parietis TaxID=570936 RepID=A0ABS4W5B1_9PSEU|nr:hypothetical protein [Pseudonocardia parietis]MBP2371350.1 hypothetical protein [Pseudonocardia parietis]
MTSTTDRSTETTIGAKPPDDQEQPRIRRRVRRAQAVLRRVSHQRKAFATDYGRARSPTDRLAVAAAAIRAALARAPEPEDDTADPDTTSGRIDRIAADLAGLLDELHADQERAATSTIRTDERRIARNQRRRHGSGTDSTQRDPTRDRPTVDPS